MVPQTPQPPAGGRVTVQLPADLEPTYANFAMITHSTSEFVIDLAQVLPQVPQARVRARVVMTPMHVKLFLRALTENVGRYETQFGEISIPEGGSLAEHLFRPPTPGNPPQE
ncbi:MAG: DUF3467 domain-containing protein [Anaerolineales bacterium]|jgi:hypothetical protein|nr:DUF3467 domain-containing protein [Anaerolineales bacterium]